MRRIRGLVLSALLGLVLAAPAVEAQEKVLNVYNWSDYIDPKLLERFTRETGIKVIYDTYDSNEKLETKLLTGSSGYDIVVPSGTFLHRQIKAGVYRKLDRSRLKNAKNIWPEVDRRLAKYDPGNQYAIDYMWFTTGIAFNTAKIRERLGDRPNGKPIDSWDFVFRPELLAKFADCGVYVLDSPEDLFAVAMRYLGIDPDSKDPKELARVADLLGKMRPNVRKFHSSEYINALANGDICLAIGWAGDSFQARNRAREAKNGVDIDYVIPKEGTLMSLDSIAIPKDAANVDAAYRFIDFLLRPDVAAQNTVVTSFANGVLASQPLVPAEILSNRSIYPDPDVMKRLFTVQPRDDRTQRLIARLWTRVKTGR